MSKENEASIPYRNFSRDHSDFEDRGSSIEYITLHDMYLFFKSWKRLLIYLALVGAIIGGLHYFLIQQKKFISEVIYLVKNDIDGTQTSDQQKINAGLISAFTRTGIDKVLGDKTIEALKNFSKAENTFAAPSRRLLEMFGEKFGHQGVCDPDSVGNYFIKSFLNFLKGIKTNKGLFGAYLESINEEYWKLTISAPEPGLSEVLSRALVIGLSSVIEDFNRDQRQLLDQKKLKVMELNAVKLSILKKNLAIRQIDVEKKKDELKVRFYKLYDQIVTTHQQRDRTGKKFPEATVNIDSLKINPNGDYSNLKRRRVFRSHLSDDQIIDTKELLLYQMALNHNEGENYSKLYNNYLQEIEKISSELFMVNVESEEYNREYLSKYEAIFEGSLKLFSSIYELPMIDASEAGIVIKQSTFDKVTKSLKIFILSVSIGATLGIILGILIGLIRQYRPFNGRELVR